VNGAGPSSGRLSSVYVGGDMRDSSLESRSLGSLKVGRWVESSSVFTEGDMGSVIMGAVRDSSCFAGVDETHDRDGDGVLNLPDPATELALEPGHRASIGTLGITGLPGVGYCVINSNFAAARIGLIHGRDAQGDNDGVPFGVAADYIGTFLWRDELGWEALFGLDDPQESWTDQDSEVRLA